MALLHRQIMAHPINTSTVLAAQALPFNTSTVYAEHGTSYKRRYCIGRSWHILLTPLLYRQIMAHAINTSTVLVEHGTFYKYRYCIGRSWHNL